MKRNFFVMMCAVALVLGVCSCGGNQELTKMIPASAVKITGDDKDFFKLAGDSVKIILTNDRPNDSRQALLFLQKKNYRYCFPLQR